MTLTDAKREKAISMFEKGKSTHDVAKSLKITVPSAAAIKANWTRNVAPKMYSVTGTFWVEASDRDSAIESFRPARIRNSNTRVIDVEIDDVHKLSAADVKEFHSNSLTV
jgi:hypothetical protein